MAEQRKQLVQKLNEALEWQTGLMIAYTTAVTDLRGPNTEPIYERYKSFFKEIGETICHLRVFIDVYLGEKPTNKVHMIETRQGMSVEDILKFTVENEEKAISCWRELLNFLYQEPVKKALPYAWEKMEHGIRHSMIEMECRIGHLNVLLARPPSFELKKTC